MARISANLGFLWSELDLPSAIKRAAACGFDAVECHWPYLWPVGDVSLALSESGLSMACINAPAGSTSDNEFGLTALPGRQRDYRVSMTQALTYAASIDCPRVQALMGRAEGEHSERIAIENLKWACDQASIAGIEILIEPKNHRDVPGYFLTRIEHAAAMIDAVGANNLKILFDCYHVQINQGDLIRRFDTHRSLVSHVQIASVPARRAPDTGEIAYARVIKAFLDLGYEGCFGAEYKSDGDVAAELGWLDEFRAVR
jgi:2-dehydrotetronate isomerase